jgi:hypothetical protein
MSPQDIVDDVVRAEADGFGSAWSVHFSRGVDALNILAVAGGRRTAPCSPSGSPAGPPWPTTPPWAWGPSWPALGSTVTAADVAAHARNAREQHLAGLLETADGNGTVRAG